MVQAEAEQRSWVHILGMWGKRVGAARSGQPPGERRQGRPAGEGREDSHHWAGRGVTVGRRKEGAGKQGGPRACQSCNWGRQPQGSAHLLRAGDAAWT